MKHKHTPEEERWIREAALDETLAETFPASDAPSTLPNPDDDALFCQLTRRPQVVAEDWETYGTR
jgi:hypothetical protein